MNIAFILLILLQVQVVEGEFLSSFFHLVKVKPDFFPSLVFSPEDYGTHTEVFPNLYIGAPDHRYLRSEIS